MYAASHSTALHADPAIAVPRNRSKLVELEALRGIAAFIGVAWHFLWAFDPARIGIVDGFDPSATMLGSVGFASIDGPAAVTLFFVLSGFVLPLGIFRTGRPEVIVRAAAKRWLRLVCLVLLAVMASWLLFRCGLYQHREAAQLSQSAWLGTFGGSHTGQDFTPSLPDAMLEGLLFAFIREPDQYNPVLWTMHHEFIGSFVSYFLAMLLWRARPPAAAWYLGTAAIVVHYADAYLFAFVVGTGLAWLMSRSEVRLPLWAALGCVGAGVFLFGYLEPRGSYAAFDILRDPDNIRFDRITIHTASGVLIILGLVGSDSFGQALASAPFRLLGKLSFPVYLFHFPLLCSLGCAMFVMLRPLLPQPLTLLLIAIVYLPVVVLISYGFARIDEAWLHQVNRFAGRLTA
jgi:peptidoglycan/LPS O-acetylase OafA/YrhL